METIGKVVGLSVNLENNNYVLSLEIFDKDKIKTEYDNIKEIDKASIVIKKFRRKRSIDANAYSWVLIDKIAKHNSIKSTSEEIYEEMLNKYGYPLYDEDDRPVIITMKANIDSSKTGLHLKFIGEGHVNNELFKHYKVIRGQSDYDTKEMSTFIDGIVSEAKELGIETLTPDELERMKAAWKA